MIEINNDGDWYIKTSKEFCDNIKSIRSARAKELKKIIKEYSKDDHLTFDERVKKAAHETFQK